MRRDGLEETNGFRSLKCRVAHQPFLQSCHGVFTVIFGGITTSSHHRAGNGVSLLDDSVRAPSTGKSSFVGNVLALGGGTVLAQTIAVLVAPVTSRLFDPEAFGLAAVFGSIVGFFAIVSCLRYELAIMLPEDDVDAAALLGLCFILPAAISLLSLAAIACCGQLVLETLQASELVPYAWLIPLALFLQGILLPLRYWNSRHRRFHRLASVSVACGASGVAATIGAGCAGYTSGGSLVMAKLVTPICEVGALLWYLPRDVSYISRHCKARSMWRMARRYVKFPAFSALSGLVNTGSHQVPPILLAAFFGTAVVGLYSRALALVALPVMLVAQAVSQVFFQRAAEKKAAGEDLGQLVEQVCVRLTGLMTLPLLMVAIIGPDIFSVLFGIKWTEAGLYAAILVPYMFFVLITATLTSLFDVLECQGTEFLFNVLLLTSRVASLVLGAVLLRDVKAAVLLFSVVSALGYAWRAHYILSTVGVPLVRIVVSLRPYLVNAALPIAMTAAARWWVNLSSVYILAVALAVSAPCYIYLLRQDTHVRQAFWRFMRRIGVSR